MDSLKVLLLIAVATAKFSNAFSQCVCPATYLVENTYVNSTGCEQYNTGVLTYGENINNDAHIASDQYLTFSSPSAVVTNPCPSWFGFMSSDASGCYFIKRDGGVDLSTGLNNAKVLIRAKASVDGAVMHVYIGSTGASSDFPTSSTWNTGTGGIDWEIILTTVETEYSMDYEAMDQTTWAAWSDKNSASIFGFAPATADVDYKISWVGIGPMVPLRIINTSASLKTSVATNDNNCGTAANVTLAVAVSTDNSVSVSTEANGHILIDPSFVTDKVVVTDMVGRTEEFSGNDFYTQLRGILVVNCISGDKVKKVKVVMD